MDSGGNGYTKRITPIVTEWHLRRFLADSETGKRIRAEIREELEREGMERQYVLIEVHADGYFKVYRDRERVAVRIVQRPQGPDASQGDIDKWVESQVPLPYRELYWPSWGMSGSVEPKLWMGDEASREAARKSIAWSTDISVWEV